MIQQPEIIKGIHPGLILERELKRRKWKKNFFAEQLDEHAQTIVAITRARRSMNTALALKAEKLLGLEEGTFMVLQAYHDIEKEKKRNQKTKPDLSKIRRVVFWDTDINAIDWERYKRAAINRIFKMGDETEKAEITRFYGTSTINTIVSKNG